MTKEEYILKEDYGYDKNKGIWSKPKERFLKGNVDRDGYVQVGLKCIDGKKRTFRYHRAMWYLAYGPIPDGYEINHLDECPQNNCLSNLECISHLANIRYGTRTERAAASNRGQKRTEESKRKNSESNINNPLKSKPVVAVKDGVVVLEFPSTREAGRHGFCCVSVSACCRNCYGKLGNYYKGYYWYYKSEWKKLVWERKLEVKKA